MNGGEHNSTRRTRAGLTSSLCVCVCLFHCPTRYAIEHLLTEIEVTGRSTKPLMKQMHDALSEGLAHFLERSDAWNSIDSPYEHETLLQNLCLTVLYVVPTPHTHHPFPPASIIVDE